MSPLKRCCRPGEHGVNPTDKVPPTTGSEVTHRPQADHKRRSRRVNMTFSPGPNTAEEQSGELERVEEPRGWERVMDRREPEAVAGKSPDPYHFRDNTSESRWRRRAIAGLVAVLIIGLAGLGVGIYALVNGPVKQGELGSQGPPGPQGAEGATGAVGKEDRPVHQDHLVRSTKPRS